MIVKFTITVTKIAELYLLTTWLMCVLGGTPGIAFWNSQSPLLNRVVPTRQYLLILLFLSKSYTICCVYIQTYKALGPFFSNYNRYCNHKITAIFLPKQDLQNDYVSQHVNLDVGKFTRPHHSWRAIYRHGKTVFFIMCPLTACLILCGQLEKLYKEKSFGGGLLEHGREMKA